MWNSLLFLVTLDLVLAHDCQHRVPTNEEVVYGVPLESSHVIRKRALTQQMRIHITYGSTLELLTPKKKNLIKTVLVPRAVDFWEKALKIRSSSKSIRLLRQCNTTYVVYPKDGNHHYCAAGCKSVTKCGENVVPAGHLLGCRSCSAKDGCVEEEGGPGVENTDFILYVSTTTTQRCGQGSTVAYAAYCQLENSLDRPVAGYVNICPDSISTEKHEHKQILATIKHEILHALGFSAGLFAFFRDSNGEPLTNRNRGSGKPPFNSNLQLYQWSDKVIRDVTFDNWRVKTGTVKKTVRYMVTPKVVEEVRRHFNCSTLVGAELEDQGDIGTALTHWEKRVFEHEAMTGTYTQNPVISRITLAFMEDTGWYGVNYHMAEPLDWGKNLGCPFVTTSCMDWMESRLQQSLSIHPFCDRARPKNGLRTECSADFSAVALCNLIEYKEPLPINYQHMSHIDGVAPENYDRYAGSVKLADYCPYVQEFAWKEGETVVRNSNCQSKITPGIKTENYALESYGNSSICLPHHEKWILRKCQSHHELEHWGSGCYRYECDDQFGLIVSVSGRRYHCARADQVLRIKQRSKAYLHEGSLVCPDCRLVCDNCPTVPSQTQARFNNAVAETTIPCHADSLHLSLSSLIITMISMTLFL